MEPVSNPDGQQDMFGASTTGQVGVFLMSTRKGDVER
jgi:hypothetical protein